MPISKPTLRDVARQAGVSLGTASQALNQRPGVAPHTRALVLEAAATLGYQFHSRARPAAASQLATIGLLIKQDSHDEPGINPFYSRVIAGAERECQARGINLMYASVQVDACSRVSQLPPLLTSDQLDGVLVVGAFLEEAISAIHRRAGAPVVLVDSYAPGSGFDSVVTDNINSAIAAVSHLIEHGHRHIGLIGSAPDGHPSIRERRKGYLRALQEHGITTPYIEDGLLLPGDARAATRRLLQRSPQITALFACNDTVAIAAMDAARELGRDIPADLSIIGFDDIDFAAQTVPPLSTMHVDKIHMGELAVRRLAERVENPGTPPLTLSLGTRLVARESVRALEG